MAQVMLSTSDNPFNPFADYAAWYTWDIAHGYYTSQYLARIMAYTYDVSELEQDMIVESAVDECVEHNVSGVFIKVTKKEDPNSESEVVAS
jgi:hypothetical protein